MLTTRCRFPLASASLCCSEPPTVLQFGSSIDSDFWAQCLEHCASISDGIEERFESPITELTVLTSEPEVAQYFRIECVCHRTIAAEL